MAQGAVHEKLWTPANVVTLLRICLVPVFVVAIISPWPEYFPFWADAEASKPWIAAGIFILLAATDGLDGYLARSRGEVTNFGKFIDPLADKILVAAALLALIELGVLPSWVALVILTREFIVSGIRMVAASQGVVIAASWYGKAKTVAQIVAIVLFIVKDSVVITDPQGVLHNPLYLVSWLAMLIALALTVISMLDYFVKAKEILGFAPSGKRAKRRAGAGEAAAADAGEDEAGGRALSAQEAASISPEALDELAGRVLEAARAAGATVGTAESLTGGLVAATFTGQLGRRARWHRQLLLRREARRVGRGPRDARLDRGGQRGDGMCHGRRRPRRARLRRGGVGDRHRRPGRGRAGQAGGHRVDRARGRVAHLRPLLPFSRHARRSAPAWKTRWIGRCCALDARHRDVSRPRYTGVASFFRENA